ncbi:MAG TPA: hypothetical protein VF881_10720 [Polyangiaceae bacterium]
MSAIYLALVPVASVLVGAVLQYWFSRAAETRKELRALRRQAYVDYLRSVTAVARANDVHARRDALVPLTDAKARIAVYGGSKVVAALARFEKVGPLLLGDSGMSAFVELASAMREGEPAIHQDLRLVLFGPDRIPLGVNAKSVDSDLARNNSRD